MKKNDIAKEIIIVLLIILLAMLINGIVLYFIPVKVVLPEPIEYQTAQNVKDILQNTSGFSADSVISSYTLGQDELYNYQATNDYRPGKTNPFSTYITQTEGEESNSNNSSVSGKSGGTSNGTNNGGNNEKQRNTPIAPGEVNPGNYSNDKGLK